MKESDRNVYDYIIVMMAILFAILFIWELNKGWPELGIWTYFKNIILRHIPFLERILKMTT